MSTRERFFLVVAFCWVVIDIFEPATSHTRKVLYTFGMVAAVAYWLDLHKAFWTHLKKPFAKKPL